MSGNKTARKPELFGYVRVSMKEQNADRQLVALEPYKIPAKNLFVEKKSGKDFDRPEYSGYFVSYGLGIYFILNL